MNETHGPKTHIECIALFGDASAAPVGILGIGGLIFSLRYAIIQIKGEHRTRAEQDMPAVLVEPRLEYSGLAADSNGRIQLLAAPPKFEFRVANYGNTPATRFRLTTDSAEARLSNGEKVPLALPGHDMWRDLVLGYPRPSASGASGTLSHTESDDAEPYRFKLCAQGCESDTSDNLDLFHSFIAGGESESPALVIDFTARFETIRRVEFESKGRASWSAFHCRKVCSGTRRERLDQLADTIAKEGDLTDFNDVVLTPSVDYRS